MNAFPWTIFWILVAVGIFGTAAVLPYAMNLNPAAAQKLKEVTGQSGETGQPGAKPKVRLPMPVLILISLVQNGVLIALCAFFGLLAGKQVGLGLPILDAALKGQPVGSSILAMLPVSVLLGLGTSVIIIAIEALYFLPRLPRALANLDQRTALWKRILACFYGGMDEEIICRLLPMGVLVWLLGLVWKGPAGLPAVGAYWLANLIAVVLFGLGHLPATAAITRITPIIVIRAILLNGIVGVACGYLFMVYGLEAAMVAHFSADIVLHLLSTPVMRRRAALLPPEPAAKPAL